MSNYDDIDENNLDDDDVERVEPTDIVGDEPSLSDLDLAEAETLTVTSKQKQREALADEVAAFLARGGKITEVPPDDSARD